MTQILHQRRFPQDHPAWSTALGETSGLLPGADGVLLSPAEGEVGKLCGHGVHSRNGDSIELRFRVLDSDVGGEGIARCRFQAAGYHQSLG